MNILPHENEFQKYTGPLDEIVSRTAHAKTSAIAESLTLREMLTRVRDGAYARKLADVQAVLDLHGKGDEYREAKKALPAFIAAGKFSKRNNESLVKHSGIIGYDFDNVPDAAAMRELVKSDPHVAYAFISPSRIGVKVGLRTKPAINDAEHKHLWDYGAEHLKAVTGLPASLDKGCKDVSRLCFVGHDPQLYANENATVLEVPEPIVEQTPAPDADELGILSDGTETPDYGEYADDHDHIEEQADKRSDADKARAALARLASWRADGYASWLNVGMVLKSCGCSLSEWESWSQQSHKYAPGVCSAKWDSFTNDRLGVGSIIRWSREDNQEPTTLAETGAFEGSEVWFGRLIANQHGDNIKHVWPWRAWMGWAANEGRWKRDESGASWAAAKETLRKLVASAAKAAGTATGEEMLDRASKFMKKNALESALKLAASEPNVVALPGAWDSDPYALNCSNGTIDLRTGKLREHKRSDNITKSTGVKLGGDYPRWRAFLERIVPDADVRSYLQRAVGYSAIGLVTEHVLHILHGAGANGKSVFCGALMHAMGDYAAPIPGTLLVNDGLREHPTIVASLHGLRLALASETEEDGKIRAAQLKQLTGGDALTARRMREDFWTFTPSHTLWLQTNHKPHTNEATHGFWRRVRLIPFNVTIPANEQDKHLAQKLREEAGGILQWIVEGAGMYLSDGLEPPEIVKVATDEYQKEQDDLADFIAECGLVQDAAAFIPAHEVYGVYLEWAKGCATKPMGRRTLTRRLQERGWKYVASPTRGFHAKLK